MNDDDEIDEFLKGAKKNLISVIYRRRRLYTQRERREKGRESEEEDRRLRRLPLPPFLSPSFFWEEEDVLDDERERTLIEIVTPHDYTIICAQRESTKRARERAKEREKRGEEDGLLLFLSRASFVGSRKRRTPWQTRRI